jgi:two-component system, NarL family, sensor histidine kinase UhpB
MWTSLSLQNRLSVLFCTLLLGTFMLVQVGLFAFSIRHLEEEREPVGRIAAQIAGAVNAELKANPSARDAILNTLRRLNDDPVGYVRYREAATDEMPPRSSEYTVPDWFRRAIAAETGLSPFPVEPQGTLMLYPSDAADVYEKWLAFLITLVTPLVLGVLAFAISRVTVRTALRPLDQAVTALSRLRQGDYSGPIPIAGPPDVRQTFHEISALAGVLSQLKESNRAVMKRIVSAEDDERAEIGRDLHDEFAPLLFAARANAHALQKPQDKSNLAALARDISSAVESIQKINARLLARLRPLDLRTLGLSRSIAALTEGPAAKSAQLSVRLTLDPAINGLPDVVARTIYRFVQEALTNVLRHANASCAAVSVGVGEARVSAEVFDNGRGFVAGTALGRGLEGMKERVAILGGEFHLETSTSGTTARCALPLS